MFPFKALASSLTLIVTTSALAGCGATARLAVADGTGPKPVLSAPSRSLLPDGQCGNGKGLDRRREAGGGRGHGSQRICTRIRSSLGLVHSKGTSLPARFAAGMFVGQHGSWNRKPRSGYKVIFVPFTGGKPSGVPIDVLTGFVRENGDAMGRPSASQSIVKAGCWWPTTWPTLWRIVAAQTTLGVLDK